VTNEASFSTSLLEIKNHIDKREFNKALELINKEKGKRESKEMTIQLLILEAKVKRLELDPEESLWICVQTRGLCEEITNDELLISTLVEQSYAYIQHGQYDMGKLIVEEASQILDKPHEFSKNTLLSHIYNIKGLLNKNKGNLDEALDFHLKSLLLRKELRDKIEISSTLNNVGLIYRTKGDFETALNYFNESLEINKELDLKHDIALSLNNLGILFHEMGELDIALEHYQNSLKMNRETDDKKQIAVTLHNIAEIHRDRRDYTQAMEYYVESLQLDQELENIYNVSETIFTMFQIHLNRKEKELAKDKLDQLNQHAATSPEDPKIALFSQLGEILFLISNKNKKDRIRAMLLLEEIIKGELPKQSMHLIILKYYCGLSLSNLRYYANLETLQKAKEQTDKLQETAIKENSFQLLVETWILQSKLALLEGDHNTARVLLNQAETTAVEKGLKKMLTQVNLEKYAFEIHHEKLQKLVGKFQETSDQEQARLVDYLKDKKPDMFEDDLTSEIIHEVLEEELSILEQTSDTADIDTSYLTRLSDLQTKLTYHHEESDSLKEENAKLVLELDTYREQVHKLQDLVEEYEDYKVKESNYLEQISSMKEQIQAQKNTLESVKKEKETLKRGIEILKNEAIDQPEDDFSIKEKTYIDQVEHYKNRTKEQEKQVEVLQSENVSLLDEIEQINVRITSQEEKIKELSAMKPVEPKRIEVDEDEVLQISEVEEPLVTSMDEIPDVAEKLVIAPPLKIEPIAQKVKLKPRKKRKKKTTKSIVESELGQKIVKMLSEQETHMLRGLAMKLGISPIQCLDLVKGFEKEELVDLIYAHREDSNPAIRKKPQV
jgi:tetratricopeptide (TPR) repeat protein